MDDDPVIAGYWDLLHEPVVPPIRARCHYCGKRIAKGNSFSWDHIIPMSRGGWDRPWNRAPACKPCNSRKASSWPDCDCAWCKRALDIHADLGDFPYR